MGYHQPQARDLARVVGESARGQGCTLSQSEDPSVAELVVQCAQLGLEVGDVLTGRFLEGA